MPYPCQLNQYHALKIIEELLNQTIGFIKLTENITVLFAKFRALHRRNADFPTIAVTLCGMFASKYGPIISTPSNASVVSSWPFIPMNSFNTNEKNCFKFYYFQCLNFNS